MWSFSSEPQQSPQDKLKDDMKRWQREMRKELRSLDRIRLGMQRDAGKTEAEIRNAARKGQRGVMKQLAKQLLQNRAAQDRILTSRTQLNSVMMQMQQQASMVKVAGVLGKSAQLMAGMNKLVNAPGVAATARRLAAEMHKSEIIGEVIEDELDSIQEEDLDDMADEEIDAVLGEITAGKFGTVAAVPKGGAAVAAPAAAAAAPTGRVAVAAGGAAPSPAPASAAAGGSGEGAIDATAMPSAPSGGGSGGGASGGSGGAGGGDLSARLAALSS